MWAWPRDGQGCVLPIGRGEAIPHPSQGSGEETKGPREGGWGGEGAALTGLMSRCRKPTEWIASMDSRICLPRRSVVLSVKVPRGWLRRRSARFRPWGWGWGRGCPLSCYPDHGCCDTLPATPHSSPGPVVLPQAPPQEMGCRDSPGAASLRS